MAQECPERLLAAILVADVVGYCRLMADDDVGTHTRLKALRHEIIAPLVARHQGRVVKLVGDGTLIAFRCALDAVRCALAIQAAGGAREAMRPATERMVLRIGVNLGMVIVEGDDLYGDGINVAARVERLAAPGGICITQTVADAIHTQLDCGLEPMGAHRLKNIPAPVTLYRVRPKPSAGDHTGYGPWAKASAW